MTSSDFRGEEVKTESSWAGPARILFITLILAGGFVYYYFGPSVEDIQGNNPKASTSRAPVTVTIAGETLTIPQNYTQFVKTRRGGNQDKVDLYAILPDFEGFTIAHQDDFEGNSPNSAIVHMSLQDMNSPSQRMEGGEALTIRMTEREKFERIYLPLVADAKGEPARYGFTRYRLTDKWAQKDEDLFVHEASDGGIILYRCLQEVGTMPSPWCRRDFMLTDRLNLSYRFKRSRLSDWRDIDRGLMKLLALFRQNGAAAPAPATSDAKPAAPQSAAPAQAIAPTPNAAPGAGAPAASSLAAPATAADAFKLVPRGAYGESAPTGQSAGRQVHRIDPNADPDDGSDSEPAGEGSDTPSAPLPPVSAPPTTSGGY